MSEGGYAKSQPLLVNAKLRLTDVETKCIIYILVSNVFKNIDTIYSWLHNLGYVANLRFVNKCLEWQECTKMREYIYDASA